MGLRDIRYAVRSLVLDRGLSTIVILCLALGIGVNATLFSVIDGVLIQSLPFAEPDRLFVLKKHPNAAASVTPASPIRPCATGRADDDVRVDGRDERQQHRVIRRRRGRSASRVRWSPGTVPDSRREPVLGRHLRAEDDLPAPSRS